MRGKENLRLMIFPMNRITPAYAGKRSLNPDNVILVQDHPRLCGEKFVKLPRNCSIVGITPAYAGKSFLSVFSAMGVKDHPRLCGEKPQTGIVKYISIGSPPPMRGKDTWR